MDTRVEHLYSFGLSIAEAGFATYCISNSLFYSIKLFIHCDSQLAFYPIVVIPLRPERCLECYLVLPIVQPTVAQRAQNLVVQRNNVRSNNVRCHCRRPRTWRMKDRPAV
jgi:hypothetical protein